MGPRPRVTLSTAVESSFATQPKLDDTEWKRAAFDSRWVDQEVGVRLQLTSINSQPTTELNDCVSYASGEINV